MINMTHGTVKIFAGNGCPDLAKAIADRLELPLGQLEATRFSDGEICVNIKETVRGCDVFVVQSTSTPVNDNLMELLVMIDAFKRASCNKLTVVMPYFGYARQDRKARARDPITAKLVANLLEKAGADRVLTMDLHSTQLQGFFDIPVDNLLGMPVLAKYFLKNGFKNDDLVIVSPDVGSVTRSRSMAAKFNAPLAIIDKRRPKANVMEVMNIIGDVKDKVCLMLDDMIDTAGTITQGAKALSDAGAREVYACCSHGVFSGPAMQRIQDSPLKKVVILNTIQQPQDKLIDKIEEVSVAEIFAEAIERIYSYISVSTLFE
ncbi:MAG TPA: ribose-phosphate diphosphokinase [Clostridiales bacterium]|jgi:ribose-phosphate diphosphokinase|nr:ribose-phosphate diphosphokinase [Subdoligranulum sp.]PWM87028.1 MAG: ribose-phosphate diphosphokinase [Subdoligranulum sp.]CDE71126.1 ribose-phosphate pyrophosphokinase [Subdoligranulum sp. CAG:314]HCW81847.1 ribose-phosphate diphosphokinase [Clostridiales bacterium]